MEKKLGDVIKIRARGEVKDKNEEGKFDIILHDIHDTTEEDAEKLIADMEEKGGILDDEDLAFVFGEDE